MLYQVSTRRYADAGTLASAVNQTVPYFAEAKPSRIEVNSIFTLNNLEVSRHIQFAAQAETRTQLIDLAILNSKVYSILNVDPDGMDIECGKRKAFQIDYNVVRFHRNRCVLPRIIQVPT